LSDLFERNEKLMCKVSSKPERKKSEDFGVKLAVLRGILN
jgi:hypothetical protein